MKKFLIFLLGLVTGVILTFIIALIINSKNNLSYGISFYDHPGDVMNVKTFEVIQSLDKGTALAWEDDSYSHDLTVLLWNQEGNAYYDNQRVSVPVGKCFRQVGLYRYSSKMGMKTVPVVTIMDK